MVNPSIPKKGPQDCERECICNGEPYSGKTQCPNIAAFIAALVYPETPPASTKITSE